MNLEFLKNNPALQNISQEKLDFILEFAQKASGKNNQSAASSIAGAASQAKSRGINFTSAETSLLIELLKQNMSESERKKADRMLMLMQTMQRPRS
ncbi:MAG: hypothetical protein ACI4DO_01845 [Roseburia sp.]